MAFYPNEKLKRWKHRQGLAVIEAARRVSFIHVLSISSILFHNSRFRVLTGPRNDNIFDPWFSMAGYLLRCRKEKYLEGNPYPLLNP